MKFDEMNFEPIKNLLAVRAGYGGEEEEEESVGNCGDGCDGADVGACGNGC